MQEGPLVWHRIKRLEEDENRGGAGASGSCVYSYHLVSPVCHGTGSVGYHHLHPTSIRKRKDPAPGILSCTTSQDLRGSWGLHSTFSCTHRALQSLGHSVCSRVEHSHDP